MNFSWKTCVNCLFFILITKTYLHYVGLGVVD